MEDTKEKKNSRPFSTYLLIWSALLLLTGVMVTLAALNLGKLSILGAIAAAAVNSTLLVLFFMHIKYEDRVFKILLGLTVFILTAVMVITFIDVSYR